MSLMLVRVLHPHCKMLFVSVCVSLIPHNVSVHSLFCSELMVKGQVLERKRKREETDLNVGKEQSSCYALVCTR